MKKHKCLLAFLSIAGTIAVTPNTAYAQSYQSASNPDPLELRNLPRVQWPRGRQHINIVDETPVIHRPPAPEAPRIFTIDPSLPAAPPAQVVHLTADPSDPMLPARFLAPPGFESNIRHSPVSSRALPPGTSVPIVSTPAAGPTPGASESSQAVRGHLNSPPSSRIARTVSPDTVLMQPRPSGVASSSGYAREKITGILLNRQEKNQH